MFEIQQTSELGNVSARSSEDLRRIRFQKAVQGFLEDSQIHSKPKDPDEIKSADELSYYT